MLKLSKYIPGRIKTIEITWYKADFMVMSDKYKRGHMRSCFWCGHKFENGEMVALAGVKGKLNKILCKKCIELIEKESIEFSCKFCGAPLNKSLDVIEKIEGYDQNNYPHRVCVSCYREHDPEIKLTENEGKHG